MTFILEELNLQNPDNIQAFERAFFTAFAPLTHNQLIRKLWIWDEKNSRLKTRVPYDEQTIFVARDQNGDIETALALGIKLQTIQSENYNFHIPLSTHNCEALAFFGLGERRMRHTMTFWKSCREVLRQRGTENIYGTCAPRVLPVYLWVGARVLESREVEQETRHFFRISLLESARGAQNVA